jgi:hypothetical protein
MDEWCRCQCGVMSIEVMSRVWKHSKASGTPLLVLLCLADFSDDDGECWPKVSTIARKCRLKDARHVKRVIHETLDAELGEVVVIVEGGKTSGKSRYRSNLYRITVHITDDPIGVVEGPPLKQGKGGSQTPLKGGSQTPQRVVEGPPEPSLTRQLEPSLISVDSRVPLQEDSISFSSRENQEDDKPITATHRRQLIAATAKLADHVHFDGTYPTEKTDYPTEKTNFPKASW